VVEGMSLVLCTVVLQSSELKLLVVLFNVRSASKIVKLRQLEILRRSE
jgi:hypothetical protein